MDQPRSALVTGTSTGIGQAIAIALAREGYDLALTELDIAALKETLAHPDIAKRKVVPIELDLRSQESIAAAFADTRARLGDIDLLVNNAGRALVQAVGQRHRRRVGRRDRTPTSRARSSCRNCSRAPASTASGPAASSAWPRPTA